MVPNSNLDSATKDMNELLVEYDKMTEWSMMYMYLDNPMPISKRTLCIQI